MVALTLYFLASLTHRQESLDDPAGRYRLRLPDEVVRYGRVFGKPVPVGRLALSTGSAFDLQAEGSARHGKYEFQGPRLTLKAEDGVILHGERKAGCIALEGFVFEREMGLPTGVLLGACGRWTVRRNGEEDRSILIELRKDGTFRFSMAGATSEGTWTVADGKLALVWTRIDKEPVALGTVHKEVPFDEDHFQIDSYRYERSPDKQ